MHAVINQIFQSVVVTIDGRSFLHCTLIDCELRYSGGSFNMVDTQVINCRWAFGGPARRTMEVLEMFDVLGAGAEESLGKDAPINPPELLP